jgi:DNA-binding MarR family transcriptional regulator
MPVHDPDPYDHLQLELAVLVRRAERARVAALDIARSPLDRSGYLLLVLLETEGEQTMSQLASAFDLDASTVTRQIAPLERRGFVVRSRSDEDRRATLVSITRAGRRERQTVREARVAYMRSQLADWDEAKVEQLAALLEDLNGTLTVGRTANGHPAGDGVPAAS